MSRHMKIRINLTISLIIALGFIGTTFINYYTYSRVIKDDIENISKLTSTNIYSDINNELTKPIFVSLTMANDSFLKGWLQEEKSAPNDKAHISKLQTYLFDIKNKYHYDSVFLVSEGTHTYYYYEGINKTVSPDNEHDQWYYSFIDGDATYDLDVDQDETANNALTVFVNCRMVDADGSLLGVVGVGIKMNEIQSLLQSFESGFNLNAFLISPDGLIQAHTDSSKIEKENIFDDPSVKDFQQEIQENRTSMESFRFQKNNLDGYLITRYINELDWYLIIEKDTSILSKTFRTQMINDLLIVILVLLLLLFFSTVLINRYQTHITDIAKTDDLTQLPNRRAYDEYIEEFLNQYKRNGQVFNVIVFDIDGFKKINDDFGHLAGNEVLSRVGKVAKDRLGPSALLARWGGDEFSGVLFCDFQQAKMIASDLVTYIADLKEFEEYGITISVGLTQVKEFDNCDDLLIRADRGLYEAKRNGKNQVYSLE